MAKGWKVLRMLADRATCEAAGRETVESGIKPTPKCVEVMELVLKVRSIKLYYYMVLY